MANAHATDVYSTQRNANFIGREAGPDE